MFTRSTKLATISSPIIEQIAKSLQDAGYKGLISEDQIHVDSAMNGFNFRVWHKADVKWIQFSMGINNTINYQGSEANKYNDNYRLGKVYVDSDGSGIWLKADLLYVVNTDITELLSQYISLWDNLVTAFKESMGEVNSRYEAEQEALKRVPPQPHAITYQGQG